MAPRRRHVLFHDIASPVKTESPNTKLPKIPSASKTGKGKSKGPALKNPLQLVTPYAGIKPDAKSVVVHKDFASHYSPVLKAAFNSNFIEGQTQEYRVDEEDEEVIRLLVHWFYTQQLDVPQASEEAQDEKSDVAGKEELCLVKLWVLADKLLIPKLQNMTLDVLDKLRLKSKAGMASKCLAYVCANTSKDSGLRRWFIHRCAFRMDSSAFLEHPERYPQQMLLDIVTVLSEWSKGKHRPKTKTEDYKVAVPEQ